MINWFEAASRRKVYGNKVAEILTYEKWPGKAVIDPCDLNQIVSRDDDDWDVFEPTDGSAPFAASPLYQRTERIIRFDGDIKKDVFETLLVIMGLDEKPRYSNTAANRKDYVVIYDESREPKKTRYLSQMRIISPIALRYDFGAIVDEELEHELLPKQTIPMGELFWLFIEQEKIKWGIWPTRGIEKLEGTFGGDGNDTHERLRFGIMLENDWKNTIRIWSDAFLLRK